MALFSETSITASGDAPWTVARLADEIKGALAANLPGKLRVVGEVSNLSDRNHWFFSLKDEKAAIRGVMFASTARRVGFPVRDGMQVVATGRIDFYDAQGSVQFYVEKLEPVGEGARELALRTLMQELRDLGYFAPEHKKPLPAIPTRLAVVTSRSAAALQDVIDTARRRWGGCELVLVDVRVQGDDAAPGISAALNYLSRHGRRRGIDAVLLTRGGGSIEDLWAFNERVVADAIFDCALPVVAAIGHETDTTVAELVADLRCATPTQAAMTLVPDRAVLQDQVAQLGRRLSLSLGRRLEISRHRLDATARHPLFQRPQRLVDDARQRVDQLDRRLLAALPRRVAEARRRVESLSRTLDAVSPKHVLERGYSYTLGPDGKLLRRAADAPTGSSLTTVLADGQVRSTVDGPSGFSPAPPSSPEPTKAPAPRTRRKPRKPKPPAEPDGQPTLFA
ncbi:MAG: exodeoxyribonuclease VII large subunit [Planctomycetota bacterium]